jgi:AcrR family transcriptional regulator
MANQKSEKSGGKTPRKESSRKPAGSATARTRAGASSGGETPDRGRIVVDATLNLAAERGWAGIGLREIATASGLSLAELRGLYASRSAILADFTARIDADVLARLEQEYGADADRGLARDRVFDVIMTRLELLAPYKSALRAILRDGASLADGIPKLLKTQLDSQRWMLAAAGIDLRGSEGALRAGGLGMIYARTLRVWLEEENEALPRTMAELDNLLNRGEKTLRRLEGPASFACSGFRLARSFGRQARDLCRDYRRNRRERHAGSNEATA